MHRYAKWEEWEVRIVQCLTLNEATRLMPHRTYGAVYTKYYELTHDSPAARKAVKYLEASEVRGETIGWCILNQSIEYKAAA